MPKRSSADPAKLAAAVKACDPSLPASRRISQRAAAKRYGVPLGTLKSRIRRAREEGGDDEADASADASSGDETRADVSSPNQRPERRTIPGRVEPDERLTGQQWRAASLTVAATMTAAQIAEEVGVSRSTIFAWRKEPVFASVCDELRRAAHARAAETVARGAEEAAHLARGTNRALMRLLRDAERTLDLHEAGEDVDPVTLKSARAMILALADKVPKGSTPMLDRGFPKTTRVEVATDQNPAERIGRAQQRAEGLGLRLITTENSP